MSVQRTFGTVTVAIALAASTLAAPSASADPQPTLGRVWGSHQVGYGTVRPATVDNGGASATGVVSNISWSSWGGPQATGTGTAIWVPPGRPNAEGVKKPATIVAFNLGDCNGRPAYRAVKWYFPGQGESFNPGTGLNICTG